MEAVDRETSHPRHDVEGEIERNEARFLPQPIVMMLRITETLKGSIMTVGAGRADRGLPLSKKQSLERKTWPQWDNGKQRRGKL